MQYYSLAAQTEVRLPAHPDADPAFLAEIFSHFAPTTSFHVSTDAPANLCTIGTATAPALPAGDEFSIRVTPTGAAVIGRDYSALMRGVVTLFGKITLDRAARTYRFPVWEESGAPAVGIRMVHLCVFPETSLDFLQKCIRSAALVKYSHVVLEFWGTLHYDCLRALSWRSGFTKEQIRPLVREARALGVEIVPMFNHLGHAAACRSIHGKHVVLDQDPTLEYLFTSRGWVWDFASEEVRALMRQIRHELMELCGAGSYFHLGCDEAYEVGHDRTRVAALIDYLNEIAAELTAEGRRGIIWGDMLLCPDDLPHEPGEDYVDCNSEREIADLLRAQLSRTLVIADWHYNVRVPRLWKSSQSFIEAGFDVIACPWENAANIRSGVACAMTKNAHMLGLMDTTWHHLGTMFPWMLYAGVIAWSGNEAELSYHEVFDFAAQLGRRAQFAEGDYFRAGWSEHSVGPGL